MFCSRLYYVNTTGRSFKRCHDFLSKKPPDKTGLYEDGTGEAASRHKISPYTSEAWPREIEESLLEIGFVAT